MPPRALRAAALVGAVELDCGTLLVDVVVSVWTGAVPGKAEDPVLP